MRFRKDGALPGYTLLAPLMGKSIHLVDLDGRVVHEWKVDYSPGSEIFLDNGNLLRCSREPGPSKYDAGGLCGRIQEIDWNGNVVWDFKYSTDEYAQHHDIELLPDGTVLMIATEGKSRADAVAAGRHPSGIAKDGMWADYLVEIEPQRPSGGEVIWEWHSWDHLIQDFDPDAENYGDVAAHPELIDLNADLREEPKGADDDGDLEEMKKLGYVGANVTRGQISADWLHLNAVDYDPVHDQIIVSSPNLSEVWILDHSTTSDEAASHEGGASGRGGDLLWRWGNPRNYGAAVSAREQQLFRQHDSRWILPGHPGAGHVTVFNNGGGRPEGDWSSVVELVLPRRPDGTFEHELGLPFGPAAPIWSYTAPNKPDFYSSFISGATRLPNGNTLICEGAKGRVFEVTSTGEIVWDFLSPFTGTERTGGPGVPPHSLFRATRIPADHPGLRGKNLTPRAN